MIKPAALMMAAVMAAITTGTYFGLDLLPQGLLPPPIGRVPKVEPAPPKVEVAPQAPVASAAPQSATPAAKPAEQPPVTEQDLAEEPAPKEQAAAPTPAPAPAESKPAPAPAPTQAAAAPAPEPEPAAKPAPAPKAKPKPAPKPQTAPPTTVAKAETSPATAPKAKPPEADVIKPWWPDASKMPANQLKLMYAGQVKGEEAIALLFSAPLSIDTVKQHAQVKADGGDLIAGEWELGKNPRLAVFRGLKPGRYTVVLQAEIADDKGFMLGATLKGPVYIQAPEPQ